MSADPALQDLLRLLRRAIASDSLPTLTTSDEPADEKNTTDDLAKATHLYFQHPVAQCVPLTTPTRFVSAATGTAVDLRSIYFAWQKKDVAIPDYITSAQELNEALGQKKDDGGGDGGKVLNLVFVERLDLITWLEGASDESEYIRPIEGAAAAAETEATAAATASAIPVTQADATAAATTSRTAPASGGPAGSSQAAAAAAAAATTAATMTTTTTTTTAKIVDLKLQQIYNGERRLGDRNSVLRGIKPTDFSHVRKTAESFLGRSRRTQPARPNGPGHRTPGPSSGLPLPSRKPSSSSRPDPIILLSPSASSLIRMSNVKSFLQDGIFVPPDHPTLAMSTSSNLLSISRPLSNASDPSAPSTRRGPAGSSISSINSNSGSGGSSRKPTRFILVDSTANFRPDYWQRLVAVFTTGQTWQFKSYKWTSPPELFKHATGVYVGWRGEEVPKDVKSWGRGVQSFAVERWDEKGGGPNGTGRWRDREVVEGIWMAIEEGMRQRGWSGR